MSRPRLAYTNPVRMGPPADRSRPRCFREGPVVQIRFTEFARLGAQGGLLTLFGASIDEAARELVRRLGVPAARLEIKPQQIGDLVVLYRMPLDAPPEYGPGALRPIAFVEGLTSQDLTEALRWIIELSGENA